jgi:hypothetical protein
MKAQVYDIISRKKPIIFEIVSVNDFELSEKGIVDARTILDNPNITLYCLDPENGQAIFVEVPDVADVLAAPFYYLSQYELAVQVLKISYQDMERLADQVVLDDQCIVLIYSMGRCGTTLISSAFSQGENVVSLSEPDVFSQLVEMLDFSNGNDPEIRALVKPCMHLTCKDSGNGGEPVWVIKFRAHVIEIADMIFSHFPGAKSLFLYRNIDPWGKSTARIFAFDTTPTQEYWIMIWNEVKMVMKKLDGYDLASEDEISLGLLISLMWLNHMERCLERLHAGQPILPVRYEDLKAEPELVIGKIFDYCGVQVRDINKLHAVLKVDSQADSPASREQLSQAEWEIDPEDIAFIQRFIAEQPVINTPDYVLPGTLNLT